jgi:1,4-dihydroxy-2-naphthoate octaprenyltransferase
MEVEEIKSIDWNSVYVISLFLLGIALFGGFLYGFWSTSYGYAGLGLISAGLTIGLFEVIMKR